LARTPKIKNPRKGDNKMANGVTLTAGIRQNLFSLQGTQNLLEQTQTRLASGKRVQSALDDPINFFAAQGHQQRANDLSARKDEMGEAVQTVQAANNGIDAITTLIESAKSLANSALSADSTTEASSLGSQFNSILDQIDTLAADSGYKGINLLNGSSVTLDVKFDEKGDSSITLTGFAGTSGQTGAGLGISDAVSASSTSGLWSDATDICNTYIETSITDLDDAITTLRSQAKTLASNLSVITARQDFTSSMINTLEDGAADLVNANMEEESANMLMLQTRQSLGISSLSMASQASQSILQLF
jgi:flagellin